MANRLDHSVGVVRADGHARVQIGDSNNHTVVNNYPAANPNIADSHLAETYNGRVRSNFLRRLQTSPYEVRKNRNPKRVDGTCEWFNTHKLFLNWRKQASALLWVSADPGCGKSVLARCLVDDFLPSSAIRTTCYFFFKDDFDDQKRLESALCCVLHQLFVQRPALLLDKILDEVEEEGEQLYASFDTLWRILLKAASYHSGGEIVCIIDALDECVDQRPLAAALTQLYSRSNGVSTLKFLVTSRPYLAIGREFQGLKDSQPTIHLSGESPEEVDKIAREIKHFDPATYGTIR
ncbi:WD-repeat protein [Apiospora rasikravindrae]|uniref:WD-repeat protein n=1 Tax=Apiospora rasikravindrae TaxID=990691 RepID=A0ABR1SPH5_9PEZI